MNALFLMCALSLPPLSLPEGRLTEFNILREFLEEKYPGYDVVFVHEDEELFMLNAEWTPVTLHGLRVWSVRRAS